MRCDHIGFGRASSHLDEIKLSDLDYSVAFLSLKIIPRGFGVYWSLRRSLLRAKFQRDCVDPLSVSLGV